MFDPVSSMLQRRDDNKQANLIRNKLQLHARNLCNAGHAMCQRESANADDVREFIGEIKGYIAIRKAVAPWVAQDGYSNELLRVSKKLRERLENK